MYSKDSRPSTCFSQKQQRNKHNQPRCQHNIISGENRIEKPLSVLILNKIIQTVCTVVGSIFPCLVYAANPTNIETQQFLRQQEQERALRERQESQLDVRLNESRGELPKMPVLEVERLPHQEKPCFTIQQIVLSGELAEQFQWALSATNFYHHEPDPALGQCLG